MATVRVKSIWASRTFWVNALTIVVSVATAVSGMVEPQVAAIVTGLLVPAVNIVLRYITTETVTL